MTPGNTYPLDVRGGDDYWPNHALANALLTDVEEFLAERAVISGEEMAGRDRITSLRRGINTPGQGLLTASNGTTVAIADLDLDWLRLVGQTWDRSRVASHRAELIEIETVAGVVADLVRDTEELSQMHKDYILTLTSAVADAARNASLYGEAQTARLANELVGALQNFLPDSEGKASALVRIKKSVGPMVSAFSTGVAAQLAANPATMRAIESGAQVIAQAVK